MSKRSKRNKGTREKLYRRKGFILISGILIGIVFVATLHEASVYFSTNESCMSCHAHPHAEESWMLSVHVNNSSGVMVNCIDCHLPPTDNTWNHYSAKAALGARDVWGYLTKDVESIDWEAKSQLEHATKYIPNESCVKCHQDLFPRGITDDGIIAHLHYEENAKKLGLHCISCHLDAGHHNPNYSHGRMVGIPGVDGSRATDSTSYFKEATPVTSFADFTEQIPGTPLSFNMIAIESGVFRMGSPSGEPFRGDDESPRHEVEVSPFFMAEVETTWSLYWAFYAETMSEGRTPPETVFRNNRDAVEVDAISGPTPPFGYPDQGWGQGDRPAITMTHYGAETFCQWLSAKTGKRYRLPTEAEWEYAARGGTDGAYFFPGSPRDFSGRGFLRGLFKADTGIMEEHVIHEKNSGSRTGLPSDVLPNPFGLKNMLGNVMEYTADRYDAKAYEGRAGITRDPLVTRGDEWVVRGGHYASDAAGIRVARRDHTRHDDWLRTDPQQPKSIWWYSDVKGIGFRVVCEPDSSLTR